MTGFTPKEKLTAYQRWEVAAFDETDDASGGPRQIPARPKEAPPAKVPENNIPLPTAEQIEQIHTEAHKQGYEAGYEEGIRNAQAQAAQIASLMTGLEQAFSDLDQKVADQLLAVALEVASQVLRQSLKLKPELILPAVREAISTLNLHLGHPTLFAHPDDVALIKTHLGEHLSHNNWRIIEDASISAGGCRVELGASEVDATLEGRWRRVVESIGASPEWLDSQS